MCPLGRGRIQRVHLHRGGLARPHLAHHDRGDQEQGRNHPREAIGQAGEVLAELLAEVAITVPADADQIPPHQAVDGTGQQGAGDVVLRGFADAVHEHVDHHAEKQPAQPVEDGHAIVVEDQERHRFLQESRIQDPAGVPIPGLKTIQRCH